MKIHVVQKGDTLWKIAQKYGVNFEELKGMNTQLSNPDMIMPGMKIKVPSDSKPVKKEQPIQPNLSEHPYKDESPKPLPVIKEEKKPKELPKKEMPKPKEQPVMPPIQPLQQQPIQMPIQMQFPTMEQQMDNYYTTVNIPQMPAYPAPQPETKPKEKPEPKEEEKQEPIQQPIYYPAYQQPAYYYPVMPHCMPCVPHPCPPPQPCMPMPHHMGSYMHCYDYATPMPHDPMVQGQVNQMEDDLDDDMEMPFMPNGNNADCGCSDQYMQAQPMMYGNYGMPYADPNMQMMPPQSYQPQPMPYGMQSPVPMNGMVQGQPPNMMPMNGEYMMGPSGNNPYRPFQMPPFDDEE
ncbi:SafA/ExsA family spore coat assembly protein [Pontibacillus litoralis]|uniref:LysM domain-containing protein n=1 Tax=Pontibacillus litoralis JSM 072002 TaxID=1385512 RepID=A0A0A5GAZ2_9BACI|nr:SafA/ExsA family spore coat assembly protein [Pontibacillus litoralis]KGX89199.1 hypothetical protein N784_01320 [Pontibacillus litoralis JSM 072002]